MSKSCKPLHPGLFLLGAATAALVFAAPQTCADALRQGLVLCGGPLLVSLFPFLVVSALIMRSGAGEVLGVLLWPVVRCIGLRSRSAGSVLLIGLVGGFAPAAAAAAARYTIEIMRVFRFKKVGGFCRGTHGKLIHVCLA